MKFTTTCLTLLAAAFVFSVPIKREEEPDWYNFSFCKGTEEECNKNYKLVLDAVTKCFHEVFDVCESIFEINSTNYKEECTAWEKSKCKSLSNGDIGKIIPQCAPIPKDYLENEVKYIGIGLKSYIDLTVSVKDLQCTLDENGNMCPLMSVLGSVNEQEFLYLNEKEINKKLEEEEKLAMEAVNATCKSKTCTDALLKYEDIVDRSLNALEDIAEASIKRNSLKASTLAKRFAKALAKRDLVFGPGLTEEEKYDEFRRYLKSDECAAQHGGITATSKPGNKPGNKSGRKCVVKKN